MQTGQKLPRADPVAFVYQNLSDMLVTVKRQPYLADIHIAIKHKGTIGRLLLQRRPPVDRRYHTEYDQHDRNEDFFIQEFFSC